MIYNEMYLDFSLDYDGQCENVDTLEIDGQDFSEEVDYKKVDDLVKKLTELEHFYVSEHRTEVQVYWKNDTMNVSFRFFNEPEDGEFDDYEINGLEPIKFEWK